MNSDFTPFKSSLRRYYFKYIVAETQEAYKATGVLKSRSDIDAYFRNRFLYYEEVDLKTGEYTKIIHTLRDNETKVSKEMFTEYCLLCIMWTAINLDWAIPLIVEDFCKDQMTRWQKQYLYNEIEKDEI